MERLNDIINRTAQRRQQSGNAQGPQGQYGQQRQPGRQEQREPRSHAGQRPEQPLPRRPLPEQTARLGQRRVPAQQSPTSSMQPTQSSMPTRKYYQHTSRNRPLPAPDYSQQARYPQRELRETYRSGEMNSPLATRQLYSYEYEQGQEQERTRTSRRNDFPVDSLNTSEPIGSTGYYPTPRRSAQTTPPAGEYYEAYSPGPSADVQEEWEEGEDDAVAMRYGDWEDDTIESLPPAIPYHGVTRNLQAMPAQLPPTRQPVSSLPAPQSMPQEIRSHRHTQPLDPQTVVNMTRDMSQEQRRTPQPIRLPDTQAQITGSGNTSTPLRGVCPICKGAGFLRADVPVGDPNFGKPVACACKEAARREKRRQQLLELSDLSAFQHSNFTNFNVRSPGITVSVKEAYKYARAFADNPHGWFVMIGPNGCGKTHLAAAIANQNLKEGAVVLFTVVPDLLAHLRSTFGPNATEAYDQRFAKMREAELLVLDDLGAHQSSPWASEKLFQLLNYRYNSSFPTVITANPTGLNGLDARILSRMTDAALVTTINLNGAIDYRPHNPRRE